MNRIIEFIIGAKDATAGAISSVLRRLQNFRKSAKDGSSAMGSLSTTVRQSVPSLVLMNNALGQSNDIITKTVRTVSSVASAFSMFGPGGAIVATVKAGMDLVANYFIDKANKMLEKAKELGAKMTGRLDKMKEIRLDSLTSEIGRVTERATKATEALNRMAEAATSMAEARNRAASARDNGELAQMRRWKAEDISNVAEEDKGVVSAAWDVKIAEKEAEIKERSANRQREADEQKHHAISCAGYLPI